MKKLTRRERFALAREARRLAIDVLEGRASIGPVYTDYAGGPACAIGQLAQRSGLGLSKMTDDPIVDRYDGAIFSASIKIGITSEAFVFPLFALASELEAAGASKTQKELKEQP